MIVGLAGKKRSGKSTAARALCGVGFEAMSFATTLKRMALVLLRDCGLSADEIDFAVTNKEMVIPVLGVSYRSLCQTLGTEWGRRHVHPDLWVIAARHLAASAESARLVFDDVRFENEAAMIREAGGVVIHLRRDWTDQIDGHASEAGIEFVEGDVSIANDGSVEDLAAAVLSIIGTVSCK